MLRILGVAIALALAVATAGVASAAPSANNPNAETGPVECEGLGTIVVTSVENARTAFGPDGRVFVVKRFTFDGELTTTTFDGEEFGPIVDSFEDDSHGRGFEGRLIECTFEESFTETFLLDAEAAEFLGVPDQYIGTEVTLQGIGQGTVRVLAPGR